MTRSEPADGARAPSVGERELPGSISTTSGLLLSLALAPLGILRASAGSILGASFGLKAATALLVGTCLVAGLALPRRPRMGRRVASLAIFGALGLAAPYLRHAPLATLAALVLGTLALAQLWGVGPVTLSLAPVEARPLNEGQARGAALGGIALWSLWAFGDLGQGFLDVVVVGWALGFGALLGVAWAVRSRGRHRAGSALYLVALLAGLALAVSLRAHPWWGITSFLGVAGVALFATHHRPRFEIQTGAWWEPLLGHPERFLVGTFAGLCLLGTILLGLPQSATSGHSIGLIDAWFTATSAACVNGLAVRDTSTTFSAFGEAALLLLIQVGGLGIMTFSTVVLKALGRRMSLRHEGAVANLISTQDRGRLFASAGRIVVFTFATEAIGALVLTAAFVAQGDGLGTALWRGVFTAVSAFCNAGFALQSDNLVTYQQAPLVLHTVAVLIVLGGLSPLAVLAIPRLVKRSSSPVPAQVRLILVSTGVLLGLGFLGILAFEWNGALAPLGWADRLHNAWFQSATLRSAGFNSIDVTGIADPTLTLMLLWMFIGGSPGSTAGGIKTTTASVLFLSAVQAIRGQWSLQVFGKRVPERARARAIVVVVIAVATGLVALLAIQLTQAMPSRLGLFEVVSALGTTGLSIGGTAALDTVGKAIIIACMFVGRVGGLTLLMFLSNRRPAPAFGRPEEDIDVG